MQILIKPRGPIANPSIVQKAANKLSQNLVIAKAPGPIRASATEGPFTKTRPISNLKIDPAYNLGKGGRRNGALYFYNNYVRQGSPKVAFLMYAAFAYSIAFPEIRQVIPTRAKLKQYKEFWTNYNKRWTETSFSSNVKIKKEGSFFTVRAPIYQGEQSNVMRLGEVFTDTPLDQLPRTPDLSTRFIPTASIKDPGSWFSPHLARLKLVHGSGVDVVNEGPLTTFYLVLQFKQEEVCALCQMPWAEIRPLDFYGLIRAWVDGRYGLYGSPPDVGIPLHKIASTLPKGGEPRLSELGILVDQNAEYWSLPREHNKISQYDTDSARFLTRDDGSFGWPMVAQGGLGNNPTKPPSSQLVFMDWVNLKMAYSDSLGKLHVKDLDRTVPANATHYRRVVNWKMVSDQGKNIITQINNIAGVLDANLAMSFGKPDLLVQEVLKLPEHVGELPQDITFLDLWNAQGVSPNAKAFWDCVKNVISYADTSIENLYSRYAFVTISNLVAFCKIAVHTCPQYEHIVAEDNERRKAYTDQGLKEDFELDPVPFMADGMGLQPHQVRGANRLKDSPKFAILAVAAGGGKTASCIYDVLKEMNKGNVRRALILCPSHLIAQYVKEFVFFTHGRVNTIACTSYTVRSHGLDGLAKMIQNSPSNTVVLCDYDLAKGKRKTSTIGYGTAVAKTFGLVEMLRQFAFDYVFCDEAHYLKGATVRQAAVARLISDIPMKRLASGTMTPNAVTDLVKQVALMDPTIIPMNEFLNNYALEMRGDKVVRWKPGYEAELMKQLKDNVVWTQATRKEWAAFLPKLIERPHFVDLNPRQHEVYSTILNEIVLKIEEEAKNSRALAALFTGKADDALEDADEDDDPIDIDKLLKPFLQRLEQFLVAPGADVYGSKVLQGDDLLSPKIIKIAEICRQHIESGEPGKILIFTNYDESAKAIYNYLPKDLQAATIHYTASNKDACVAQFDRDEKKKIMVGIELSMNTGLNLQAASRLIRVDSVWTPGSLEQGNSRIQRPNVKVKENRTNIYIDWITANASIDVTKMCYLFAKQVAVSKWEGAGNPKYEEIDAPDLFPMTLDVIRASNSTNNETLAPYFQAYKEVKTVQFQEFDEYERDNPGDKNPDGTVRRDPITRAPNLPGSALMARVPYVPGTELYKATDLGLVRYDVYLGLNEKDLEEGEDEEETEEDAGQRAKSAAEFAQVEDMPCHTEYGDGRIVRVSYRWVTVKLDSGSTIRVYKLAAFIITRKQTSGADMRDLLQKQIAEDSGIPYEKPVTIRVKDPKSIKIPQLPPAVASIPSVYLELTVMNDFVGLRMENAEKNPEAARILEAHGFEQPTPYGYALMPNAAKLKAQMAKWQKDGFTIKGEYNQAVQNLYLALESQRKNAAHLVGVSSLAQLKNFFRMNHKPVPGNMTICPYPLVVDDNVYLALPIQGHPGSLNAIKHKATGVTWKKSKVEDQRVIYFPSLQKLNTFMANWASHKDISISNLSSLHKEFVKLHKRKALVDGLQK